MQRPSYNFVWEKDEEWISKIDPYGDGTPSASASAPKATLARKTQARFPCERELRIPPLPRSLLEAIELTREVEGPELEQVIEMVRKNPMVVARLLRVANSAYHGQRGEITNAQRAVIVLGPANVLGIVMSMSLMEVRSSLEPQTAASFLNLVRHSIATGFLAQRLLLRDPAPPPALPREYVNEVFTAGLLHDFGKLVLLYNFPTEGALLYGAPAAPEADLIAAERDLFGYDHLQAGVFLAQRLEWPAALAHVIAAHHGYDALTADEAGVRVLVGAVAAANAAANAFGFVCGQTLVEHAYRQHPLWRYLVGQKVLGYPSEAALLQTLDAARDEVGGYVAALL